MPRHPRLRRSRRAREREHASLVRDLDRLWTLAPGGTAERPIAIESPAQVEPIAAATPCPLCGDGLTLESHDARVAAGERLRVARLRCPTCGVRRALHFRLGAPLQ